MNLDSFNKLVGQTILECQKIEHDVKLIYAGMLKGEFNKNFNNIKNKALGPVLVDLEKLDNSDGKPYFKQDDYDLLFQIKDFRNWIVHSSYVDFMYEQGQDLDRYYRQTYLKLQQFYGRINHLGDQLERLRLQILKYYGRI